MILRRAFVASIASFLTFRSATAQTYSTCNPLTSSSCPADTALGKSINVDFTKGSVNSFSASGSPSYDSNGVSFTVAKSGDAPQLTSLFYIMFGKVSITMKAAPGTGIVSSFVLQSDDLDEIDMEWLGTDSEQVQTNYFGKGMTTDYNRGAFNPAANNQGEFIKYTIEWTSEQITWSVGSTIVRVLTPATADANQYPQTPMVIKFGSWAGGDSSNAQGTITWAGGLTDYSKGPFSMLVKSLAVTDYSTGTQYKYGDTTGNWQSIEAVGGSVNGNSKDESSGTTADAPSVTSASLSIPPAFGGKPKDDTSTQTGWPWVAGSTTLSTATVAPTQAGIPSGWIITSSGKVVPANSAATSYPTSTSYSSASRSSPSSEFGPEISTGWDDRGFPTTKTFIPGASVSYDEQGSVVSTTMSTSIMAASSISDGDAEKNGIIGKVAGTSTGHGGGVDGRALPTAMLGLAALAVGSFML